MNKRVITIFVCLVIILLVACSPAPQAIQTAIAQTATQVALLQPTDAPTITESPTSTITSTLTRTNTPLPTNTPTPLPPETLTAFAIENMRTATAASLVKQKTATAASVAMQKTATAAARATRQASTAQVATQIAQYKDIYWKELVSYPDNHKGETVKIHIRVFNVVSTRELQGYFGGTYEAVYIDMQTSFSELYENDILTIYGTVGGDYCFTNAYNAKICQPLIEHAFYTKP